MLLDQTKLKTALSKLETEGDSRYSEGIILGVMAGIIACDNYTLEEAWLLVKNLLPKEWTQVQKQIEFNLRLAATWVGNPESCNICSKKFQRKDDERFYDARTKQGGWAILCDACFMMHGVGLGTGSGQKYEYRDGEWIKTGG